MSFRIFYQEFDFSISKWISFVYPAMEKLEREFNENKFPDKDIECGQKGMTCDDIRKIYKKIKKELKEQKNKNNILEEKILQQKNLLMFYRNQLID